jgi:2-amino-4-hydroxy-6-hydroxymethyldihydropteridine diphosphokinase
MTPSVNVLRTSAWIGLGSNLGNGRTQLEHALAILNQQPAIKVLRTSSLYRTSPWGVLEQPDFCNAVAELSVQCDAIELLRLLKKVEMDLGRSSDGTRWGPREVDLDLLLFDSKILIRAELVVPHPRMHQRAFVLVPLYELEPGLNIPARGTVRSCLWRLCGDSAVETPEELPGIERLAKELRI